VVAQPPARVGDDPDPAQQVEPFAQQPGEDGRALALGLGAQDVGRPGGQRRLGIGCGRTCQQDGHGVLGQTRSTTLTPPASAAVSSRGRRRCR
jgi:hypothetical protein